MDTITINIKGTERGLDKLESDIGTENLWHSRILSNNLCDEVGDYSDHFRVIVEEDKPNSHGCSHQQTQ